MLAPVATSLSSPGRLISLTGCPPSLLVSRSMSAVGETIPLRLAVIRPAAPPLLA